MGILFKRAVYLFLFCMVNVNLYALYPEKSGYTYKSKFTDIYVGVSVGSVVTQTWGKQINYGFQSMVQPQRMVDTGTVSLNMGFRPFGATGAWGNFRIEGETQYFYVKQNLMYDKTKLNGNEFDRASLPIYGQEVLKSNIAFNLIYDFRVFSQLVYPYFGVGVGYGLFKMAAFDVNEQPNGMGEEYGGEKNMQFNQFIVGFQYDTKIIKASTYIQYKVVLAGSRMLLNPQNDGTHHMKLEKYPDPDWDGTGEQKELDCPVEGNDFGCIDTTIGVTSPLSALPLIHSISFGFRYYLY